MMSPDSPPGALPRLTTERWRQITHAVDAALERPRIERLSFLDRFCAEDPELCAAAKRLLEACESAGTTNGFMADSAGSYAATIVADLSMRISAAEDALSPALGAALAGRYVVERELGRGGMAIVYLARDARHGRHVALKVLRPELRESIGAKRFLQEVQITARLTHPHILPLLDSGEVDGVLYYVMPHVEGESLRARLEREIQLPIDEAIRIAREVADALDCSHRHGIVHRDIKPENILLEEGHAVVADFGIARAVIRSAGDSFTSTGVSLGTPRYMSPEQSTGETEIDGRSDIYALGCVLHEMIAGETPFTGPTVQAVVARSLSMRPTPLGQLREGVSEALEAVVLRALAKVPADRYQTAAEVRSALETASLAKVPADRFQTAGQLRDALAAIPGESAQPELQVIEPTIAATSRLARARTWMRSHVAALGVSAIILLALAGGILAGYAPRDLYNRARATILGTTPVPASRRWIVVADFEGPADDPSLANAARALITTVLNQSRLVATVPSDQLRIGLRASGKPDSTTITADVARELALRGSISAVVTGRVDRVGKTHALTVQIIQPDSGTVLVVESGTSPDADAFIPLVETLGKRLRHALGETLPVSGQQRALPWATTPSFAAWRLFAQANKLIANQRRDLAIGLLRDAVALDSGFAGAWTVMAVQFYGLGMMDSARTALAHAGQHLDRLGEDPRLNYYGIDAIFRGDRARQLQVYDELLARNPSHGGALVNRANALADLLRYDEAIASTRQAIAVSPFGPGVPAITNLSRLLMEVGKWQEARSAAQLGEGPISEHRLLQVALGESNWALVDSLARAMMLPGRPTSYRRTALLSLASREASRGALSTADSLLRVANDLPAVLESVPSERRPAVARLMLGFVSRLAPPDLTPPAHDTSDQGRVFAGIKAAITGDTKGARLQLARVSRTASPNRAPRGERRQESGINPGVTPASDSSAERQLLRASIAFAEGDWRAVVRLIGASSRASHEDVSRTSLSQWNFARWLVATAHERMSQPDSAVQYYEMIVDPIEAARNDELELRGLGLPFAQQRLVVLYAAVGRAADARRHWEAFSRTLSRPDPVFAPLIAEAQTALARAESARR